MQFRWAMPVLNAANPCKRESGIKLKYATDKGFVPIKYESYIAFATHCAFKPLAVVLYLEAIAYREFWF
jgi:hypothetical protein